MEQMSIFVKLRPSTLPGEKGSIYFLFIKKRMTKTITTPYRVYQEEWNSQLSSIRLGSFSPKRESELREIVISLEKDKDDLMIKIRRKEQTGGCSLHEAVDIYRNRCSYCFFSEFVETLTSEMLMPQQCRLAEAYRSASNNMKAFNQGRDLPLNAINANLMQAYEAYMKAKGNELNTISFYNRNTRAIYNKAIKRGLIEKKNEDPFAEVFKGVAKTRKRAVKQEVIDELKKLDIEEILNKRKKYSYGMKDRVKSNKENPVDTIDPEKVKTEEEKKDFRPVRKSLNFARDMFLLCFYLRGISFIDLAFLKKTNMEDNLIVYTRHKTGQRLEVAITSSIRKIIQQYAHYCKDSEFLLPILSNNATRNEYINALKRENRHLKILSSMIGLKRPLTTYVSRHSWASIARTKGIPLAVISQGLGHESEKTTQIYLDSFDFSILHKANQKITELSKKAS